MQQNHFRCTEKCTFLKSLAVCFSLSPLLSEVFSETLRRPRLKQQRATGTCLLRETSLAGEDALAAQPGLAYNALERLVLIRRDLISEEHGAGFDLLGLHLSAGHVPSHARHSFFYSCEC
jgi:hypothetical protein